MATEDAIRECLISPNVPDSNLEDANVVDVIAGAGLNISRAIKSLGLNGAATNMGALEVLAKSINDGCQVIADGLHHVAESIENRK